MNFYDRQKEVKLLLDSEKQSQQTATFTVLTGRRRVGKTALLHRAMAGKQYAYLYVARDSEPIICAHFQKVLETEIGLHIYGKVTCFRDLFETIMRESLQRHFTIIFDEFQTIYDINPAFFSEMQALWDRYHNESKLNLIVSGSIQSLMNRIFGSYHEPLYGRPTSRLHLLPFSVNTLKHILSDYHPNYKNEDLLCLYMLTGGVAKYVELLMDARCTTKEKMLNYVCRPDSYFLSEGRVIIQQEFKDDSVTYFSILSLIAAGRTRRNELDGAMQKDVGPYLLNLEQSFHLITRLRPLFAKPNGKVSSYEIQDHFLRFWFRFIWPYQSLIERQQLLLLRRHIDHGYEQFTGRTLERYFQDMLMQTGDYTQAGNWWDRKGENEIDLIALNEFEHTGLVAEIKRNSAKIDLHRLEQKVANLPSASFGNYNLTLKALSIKDM